MTCQMMTSLGVYVLDAADAGERQRVEAHLTGCPSCQAELGRLAGLPSLLAGVPEDMLAVSRSPVPGQPARSRRHERARRPWRAMAAAACVAAVAGAAGGFWLAPRDAGREPATVTMSGANPAAHVTATAALTTTSWGTSIELQINGVPLNVQCRLIVRSRTGATEVAGIWDAWSNGPISIPASAAWLPSDIASLQVATATGDLVTINADARHSANDRARSSNTR